MKLASISLRATLATTVLSVAVAGLGIIAPPALAASDGSLQDIIDSARSSVDAEGNQALGLTFQVPDGFDCTIEKQEADKIYYAFSSETCNFVAGFTDAEAIFTSDEVDLIINSYDSDSVGELLAESMGQTYIDCLSYSNNNTFFTVFFFGPSDDDSGLMMSLAIVNGTQPVTVSTVFAPYEIEAVLPAIDEFYSSIEPAGDTGASAESPSAGRIESSPDLGDWNIKYYVDEFDRPTDEAYLSIAGEGTFSNSATTDDELEFRVLFDNESFAVTLDEYGSHRVKGYMTIGYDAKVLDSNGEVYEMPAYLYEGSDRVYFSDYELIRDILSRGGTVRFNLVESDDPINEYNFAIDATGFNAALGSLYPGMSSTDPGADADFSSYSGDGKGAVAAGAYADGTYEGTGKGIGGDVPVTVTVEGGKIASVEVGDNSETQGIGTNAIEQLPALIVEAGGTEGVEGVSGATVTSNAILDAVETALEGASR